MATYEQELQKAQQELNKWFLGKTSKRYESGSGGPATISSGVGDPGGISYGSYQLSTTKGTLAEYLKYSDNYNHAFDGLKPKTKEFDQKWKELANNDPQFHQSQHEFIASKHYQPQLQALKQAGFDFSKRGKAVQDMVWSLAVQHRRGTMSKIDRGEKESGLDFKTATDAEIIEAVYDSKLRHYKQDFRSSSPKVQEGVRKRILSEKADLLRLDRYEKLLEGQQQEKEKNADKNGTTGYRVKIDGGNPIEFRKKYLEIQVSKGEHEVTIFRTGLKKVVKKIKVVGKEAKVSVRIDVSLPIMMVILQLIINNFILQKPSILRTIISVIFLILFVYLMFMREVIKVDVEE